MSKYEGLVEKLNTKAQEEGEITNDGGLGDIARDLQKKIESGEVDKMSKKELMDTYMSIVSLSGSKALITTTKLSLMKKQRPELVNLVKNSVGIAMKYSK